MDKRTQRKQVRDSAQKVNCWLQLAERMLRGGSSPAERALRYSLHTLTGPTAETTLKPEQEFWEITDQLQTLYEEFYVLEMDFDDETDATELTIVDYIDAMSVKQAKSTFVDLEIEALRIIHCNEHVMLHHVCEVPYLLVSKVLSMDDWLCDNTLPQWVIDSESALEDVRTLFT